MHTNIDIDQDLLREALELGTCRTKKDTVNEALAEYVRIRKQRKVAELFGKVEFDGDYDYKAERLAR
jgi:Arc/MetJ family transcription regulator